MKAKHLCLLLLPFVAISAVRGQNSDDLAIPVENDNQFPPEQQAAPDDGDILEGSGIGAIPQPEATDDFTSTTTEQAPLEDVLSGTNQILDELDTFDNQDNTDNVKLTCPDNCLCNVEGENFVTDCSGLELTNLPSDIDSRTTKLKLQNNKLTEIPKEISALTNLKELNASSNMIQDLALGSVSTLSELLVLDLEKNRLLVYPMDLKNSFDLTKLQILNLGGNDIREPLESDALGKFTSLEKIVVPANAFDDQLEVGLCKSLGSSLKSICVETCEKEVNCPDSPDDIEDDMLNAKIPATIFADIEAESDLDPAVNTPDINEANNEAPVLVDNETPLENASQPNVDLSISEANATPDLETNPTNVLSSRSGIMQQPETGSQDVASETPENDSAKVEEPSAISRFNILVETPNPAEAVNTDKLNIPAETTVTKDTIAADTETAKTDGNESSNYKVGATTSDSKSAGVDKSVIGIIVAGMVVVVAGITIQKNWTSIKRRFSSNSRTPDRPAGNANGTTAPEEVPLQDKSPV